MSVSTKSPGLSAGAAQAQKATLLPLGALVTGLSLAGGAFAQTPASVAAAETVMPVVRASASAAPEDDNRNNVQATTTRIGKTRQELRDVPQSVTVVTEKLIDDRNLETMKDALKMTAGITFLAAEGAEEDIRLRGFPLQASGDVFADGMRDPAFYERDTFFTDRIEVLRGSASMLFGRGSTGGAVNLVSKTPRLMTEHQVDLTLGSHNYRRGVGDFNVKLGQGTAVRVGAMQTQADNNGSGTPIDKAGLAAALRTGVGERHEFAASAYWLENRNGMNYGMPFINPTLTSPVADRALLPLDPKAYYAPASDRNHGSAEMFTLNQVWRLAPRSELNTRIRHGRFERDQRASTIRFANAAAQPNRTAVSLATFDPQTVLTRGNQFKIQDMQTTLAQSDYSGRFNWGGMRHELAAGIDWAHEKKQVYAVRTPAQGGVTLTKPATTVGTPNDGARVDEDSRVLRPNNAYESNGFGVYVQDLIEFAPKWKLLLGLRYDRLVGDYEIFAPPTSAADPGTTVQTPYRMEVSEFSHRAGLLFQPDAFKSFHFSAATSFNTSGDAYSLSAANVDIPPEQSLNIELGAKLDSANGMFTTRVAIFRSTKLQERNTDPLINVVTLSGQRQTAGLEIDVAGRPIKGLEIFGSFMWLPVAVIDEAPPGPEGKGARPSLTPVYSGTLWATYQLTPALRLGAGLNARGAQQPLRNPGFFVPAWVTGDLMAEYVVLRDRFTVKANLTNVSNKLYADALYPAHYVPGSGRVLQVTGSLNF